MGARGLGARRRGDGIVAGADGAYTANPDNSFGRTATDV